MFTLFGPIPCLFLSRYLKSVMGMFLWSWVGSCVQWQQRSHHLPGRCCGPRVAACRMSPNASEGHRAKAGTTTWKRPAYKVWETSSTQCRNWNQWTLLYVTMSIVGKIVLQTFFVNRQLNIDWNNGRRSRADDLSTNSFRVKRFQSNHPLHVRNLIFKQVGRLYNALNDYPAIGMKQITAFMRLLQKRCWTLRDCFAWCKSVSECTSRFVRVAQHENSTWHLTEHVCKQGCMKRKSQAGSDVGVSSSVCAESPAASSIGSEFSVRFPTFQTTKLPFFESSCVVAGLW